MKKVVLVAIIVALLSFVIWLIIPPHHIINSIEDKHFSEEGIPLDTIEFFVPSKPTSAKLYIETSGSMNGFLGPINQINLKKLFGLFSRDSKRFPIIMFLLCLMPEISMVP